MSKSNRKCGLLTSFTSFNPSDAGSQEVSFVIDLRVQRLEDECEIGLCRQVRRPLASFQETCVLFLVGFPGNRISTHEDDLRRFQLLRPCNRVFTSLRKLSRCSGFTIETGRFTQSGVAMMVSMPKLKERDKIQLCRRFRIRPVDVLRYKFYGLHAGLSGDLDALLEGAF